MKHIVFILGNYYPFYSAVGNCAEKVISSLKEEYKVSVISTKNSVELEDFEVYNGYEIHRVESKFQKEFNSLSVNAESNRIDKFKFTLCRVKNLIKFLFRPESVDQSLTTLYVNKLNDVNTKEKIDVVVPLIFPIESAVAAMKFQKLTGSNCYIIPYWFDNFANSVSLHRFNLNRRLKYKRNRAIELELVNNAKSIIAMHPLQEHFNSTLPYSLYKKIKFTEHPLLLERDLKRRVIESDKIRFAYTGGLFKGVRTADGCLNVFSELAKLINIKVDFYCFGTGASAVDLYEKQSPKYFQNYGMVSRTVAEQAVTDADILISIGDVEGKQLSSKIFDYLSLGKPIVHFAYVESCVNSKILMKYPLSLTIQLRQDNQYEAVILNSFVKFCNEVKGKRLDFGQVSNIYPEAIPQTTAKLFSKIISTNAEY